MFLVRVEYSRMKGFALILLSALVAVQGRHAGVETTAVARADTTLGENPWVVHLRLAVTGSGYLRTCTASLIDPSFVLTSASCIQSGSFAWLRYGVIDVISPSLVTESTGFRPHPEYNAATNANNIAIVAINRVIELSTAISPVALASAAQSANVGVFCAWGAQFGGGVLTPRDHLQCYDVAIQADGDNLVASGAETTQFDLGAPLVSNGVQYGVLIDPSTSAFIRTSDYNVWISGETGLSL